MARISVGPYSASWTNPDMPAEGQLKNRRPGPVSHVTAKRVIVYELLYLAPFVLDNQITSSMRSINAHRRKAQRRLFMKLIIGIIVLVVIGALIGPTGIGIAVTIIVCGLAVLVFIAKRSRKKQEKQYRVNLTKTQEKESADRLFMRQQQDDFISWDDSDRYRVEPEDFEIVYFNEHGQKTERKITIQTLLRSKKGQVLVHAYCHLRNGNRTFYADRIASMKKGNQELDVESFLNSLIEKSPDHVFEKLEADRGDELYTLMYIAKLDGRLTQVERAIIGDYFSLDPDSFPSFDISTAQYKRSVKVLGTMEETQKVALREAMIKLIGKKPDDLKKATVALLK